jgi:Ca2+-binding RTX toxin-like protein
MMPFESLETRRLLSATLEEGVLRIEGTAQADDFELRSIFIGAEQAIEVKNNGEDEGSFALAAIDRIEVRLLAGKDRYKGNDTATFADVTAPTRVYGGKGNDTLLGSAGRDRLFGQSGNDRLFGNGGKDILRGQGGDDRLNGNAGSDLLIGGTGDDILDGGDTNAAAGIDTLQGNAGRDSLYYDTLDDELLGGPGKDKEFLAE